MIRGGIRAGELESYLLGLAGLSDAVAQLRRESENLAVELIQPEAASGAILTPNDRAFVAAPHTVAATIVDQPWPRTWPPTQAERS